MERESKHIVIAAGGTGGHLFPAQALARDWTRRGHTLIFMGKGLSTSRFFSRNQYAYQEVASSSILWKRPFVTLFSLVKGTWQAYRHLGRASPRLVVGFGSFHAFPVLLAAWLKGIPLVLFESNSIPGKVTRLFSGTSLFSAVQFSSAKNDLKGKSLEVSMPMFYPRSQESVSKEDLAAYFDLDPEGYTLLIFGGSQGAKSMNSAILEALSRCTDRKLQVIHIAGSEPVVRELEERYRELSISACVKVFEDRMEKAWSFADLAICRAGAATLSELLLFEVPSLLIPFPYAAEEHQKKNALFMEREVGGGFVLEEKDLSPETLVPLLEKAEREGERMRKALYEYKQQKKLPTLVDLLEQTVR